MPAKSRFIIAYQAEGWPVDPATFIREGASYRGVAAELVLSQREIAETGLFDRMSILKAGGVIEVSYRRPTQERFDTIEDYPASTGLLDWRIQFDGRKAAVRDQLIAFRNLYMDAVLPGRIRLSPDYKGPHVTAEAVCEPSTLTNLDAEWNLIPERDPFLLVRVLAQQLSRRKVSRPSLDDEGRR